MKYLKAFESFNNDELIDYIKDILVELKDVGVSYRLKTYGTSLFIRMTREEKQYKWHEVEPFIEHLISYLSEYGFKLNEKESSKDLLKSWENRRFNYLEVRFDLVKEKEKKTWKNFFKKDKKKYSTLDLRNGNVYVKFSGKDFDKMLALLKDAFPGDSYISSGVITKGIIYYAKSKFYYASTTNVAGLKKKAIVTEDDIELSTKRIYESLQSLEDKIETVNNICLELSDSGFFSDKNGRILDEIKLQPADGMFKDKSSVVSFHKGDETFSFNEVSECVYRIKNIIGIENIGTFNYRLTFGDSYTRCDMDKLENETLESNIKDNMLKGGFITFNFPVNQ